MEAGIPNRSRGLEAAETLLARNLLAARSAAGWTQDALSAASNISRATIAQLESGVSDPRLSTLAALSKALNLPVALLLISEIEVRSLTALQTSNVTLPGEVSAIDLRQLNRWVNSGMLRDRAEAVKWTADYVMAAANTPLLAAVVAALFVTFLPDRGLNLEAVWGELMFRELTRPTTDATSS